MSKYNKQYYIDRIARDGWGKTYADDKYYDDEDLYDSFFCFTHYAFAYLGLPSPSVAQIELAGFISDRSNPHRMVACLRGLSKSLNSQLYTVWRLLNEPNEKILVMSATGQRAVNFTQFVQKLLAMLPVCNGMQPRHNKERTSSQAFDVAGATPSDSPSLYAVGAGNSITGMRASLIIYDDIVNAQNSGSAVQRDKLDHYASEAANLLMTGKDESICLCTFHSQDDIYVDWINVKGFKPFIIPAEYPSDVNIYNGGLAPYIIERLNNNPSIVGLNVDERFTLDILESKRQRIGKSQYKLQYMLDVSASDELKHPLKLADLIVMDVDLDDAPIKISPSTMRENMVLIKHNGFNTDRLYSPSFISEQRAMYSYRVMAIDPSGSGSDETGIAIGFTCGGRIHVKKCTGMKGGYSHDTLGAIAQMCSDYKVDTIVIEKNFGDGMYRKLLEPILAKISPFTSIEDVRAVGQKEKRIIRILEPYLNQRKIVIDKKVLDDDNSANLVNSLTYQLTRITEEAQSLRHDDRLEALAYLAQYLFDKENMDEDAVSANQAEEQLRKDLEQLMLDFGYEYNNNYNYSNRF